ncbi:transport protein Sec61 subunit gamma-like protein [Drosera capensis]
MPQTRSQRTAIGFVVMGFVGFFVKLIFIPINNIIVGSVYIYWSICTCYACLPCGLELTLGFCNMQVMKLAVLLAVLLSGCCETVDSSREYLKK